MIALSTILGCGDDKDVNTRGEATECLSADSSVVSPRLICSQ